MTKDPKRMTPEELDDIEADRLPIKRVNTQRLIDEVRKAWAERDRLRTCQHTGNWKTSSPAKCADCGWRDERKKYDDYDSVTRQDCERCYEEGAAQEREACAKLAEELMPGHDDPTGQEVAGDIARAIRARGKDAP